MSKSKLDRYPIIERSAPLIDIQRSGHDRRTVTAYAATFDHPYRVQDFDGDYDETINRAAFTRHLSQHGITGVSVFYNHGMTIFRTPSERYSMPLGTPLEIKPDTRGLLTVTRYANTDLADEVLELIDNGSIKAQSFRGPIIRSGPRKRGANGRTQIERLELGLTDFGPAPSVVNTEAEIMAIRSMMIADQFEMLSDEEKQRLFSSWQDGTPDTTDVESVPVEDPPETQTDTPDTTDVESVPVEDPSVPEYTILANANRRRR